MVVETLLEKTKLISELLTSFLVFFAFSPALQYPYHEGTKVTRLLEMCLQKITANITDYCLEGIEEYLIE